MIQWSRRWLMIRQSPPLPQTSLSHFLFGSLFCVCPARAGQFLFVFLLELVTFTMEGFIWRGFLNRSADASSSFTAWRGEFPNLWEMPEGLSDMKPSIYVFFPPVWLLLKKIIKKHLSSHRCWADTKSIHPTKILQHSHLILLSKRGSLPCIGQKTSWYMYMFLFYFNKILNNGFIMVQEVSRVLF